jgi:hypothetical protein
MKTKDKIKIMDCYNKGITVEYKLNNNELAWKTLNSDTEPTWNWETYTYRIHSKISLLIVNINNATGKIKKYKSIEDAKKDSKDYDQIGLKYEYTT